MGCMDALKLRKQTGMNSFRMCAAVSFTPLSSVFTYTSWLMTADKLCWQTGKMLTFILKATLLESARSQAFGIKRS